MSTTRSFTVEMSDYTFRAAFDDGCFWLLRKGAWHLIHVSCFEVEVIQSQPGTFRGKVRFTLKPQDHWGRLMYWRLCD